MALAMRKGSVVIHLLQDADLPVESRPAYIARYITEEELIRVEELYIEATGKTRREASGLIDQALAILLIGWRNVTDRDGQPVAFDLARLGGLLTATEKQDLLLQLVRGVQLGEEEIKKSAARSASDTALSAQDATARPAANA